MDSGEYSSRYSACMDSGRRIPFHEMLGAAVEVAMGLTENLIMSLR